MKCQPIALGVAIGALWTFYVFCLALVAMFGWGTAMQQMLASLYLGYEASIIGALIGAVWAFVDGFIAGVVIAWIYNAVAE